MTTHPLLTRGDAPVSRRGLLAAAGIVSATTILGVTSVRSVADAAALTKEQRDQMTPDNIIASGQSRIIWSVPPISTGHVIKGWRLAAWVARIPAV